MGSLALLMTGLDPVLCYDISNHGICFYCYTDDTPLCASASHDELSLANIVEIYQSVIGWICLIAFPPNTTPLVKNQGLVFRSFLSQETFTLLFMHILIITIIIHPLA